MRLGGPSFDFVADWGAASSAPTAIGWDNKSARAKLRDREVTLRIPADVAERLSAAGGDVSRRALEALVLEGYREQAFTPSFGNAGVVSSRDRGFFGSPSRSSRYDRNVGSGSGSGGLRNRVATSAALTKSLHDRGFQYHAVALSDCDRARTFWDNYLRKSSCRRPCTRRTRSDPAGGSTAIRYPFDRRTNWADHCARTETGALRNT